MTKVQIMRCKLLFMDENNGKFHIIRRMNKHLIAT